MPEPNPDKRVRRWPTGATFVLYCAGLSLVLLVIYVISSGKLFEFSANENGVVFKSALNHGTVSADTANKRSEELKAKLDQASIAQPTQVSPAPGSTALEAQASSPSNAASFTGTWTGGGSTYIIKQNGADITLAEWTNDVLTSYGNGTVSGGVATLSVNNIIGLTLSVELTIANGRIAMSSGGQTIYLEKS
jgi:hypothetical protein